MPKTIALNVPVNRVEGDLEVRLEVTDGIVTDAWSSGTMYRGFENLLVGRSPLDSLVLTPRICGICGTAHLMAASQALEMILGITPPPAAIRLRHVALMVEKIQSELRHAFLMFAPDFLNPAYQDNRLFASAMTRYRLLRGKTVIETVQATKQLVEIIAIIGGQWPHSSYMIPGGITSMPSSGDLLQCSHILRSFKSWYERIILGCSLKRWLAVKSMSDLEEWMEESEAHANSEIGFFIRFSREIGLDRLGRGYGNFISYGAQDLPPEMTGDNRNGSRLISGGFSRGTDILPFSQEKISEHVDHSWFVDDSGRHPFEGETRPCGSPAKNRKYSWAKAPRYDSLPVETGPLAQMVISGNQLISDLIKHQGPNVFVREMARLVRSAGLIRTIETCLSKTNEKEAHYVPTGKIDGGQGFGLVEATRGILGHWVVVEDGKIKRYQVITPTTWNASPRDGQGIRGPWEEALIGCPVADSANPVEIGHVIRSFDACLYCTVHVLDVR